jgi:hypothetical protein
MDRLHELLGRELDVTEVARKLYEFAGNVRAPVVGAMQVTCSDESERECIDAFQNGFAGPLLPSLKFGERTPFRIASLGGRYEWGAAAIAEDHFATPASAHAFKLMLIKINSHVSVESDGAEPCFGHMRRYERESTYCGALHALMEGGQHPFTDDLHEAFTSEGGDRLAMLLDEQAVPPALRSLYAAVVNARLQSRRCLVDIQDRRPVSPTLYIVLPCVTLNRRDRDTEIVCGVYRADWRSGEPAIEYRGVGDDPAAYTLNHSRGRMRLEDPSIGVTREARDHRRMVLETLQAHRESGAVAADAVTAEGAAETGEPALPVGRRSAELERLLDEAAAGRHHEPKYAGPLLKTLLGVLAQLNPVTSVAFLFAAGVPEMHHLFRVQRLVRGLAGDDEARGILRQIEGRVDTLPPERARRIVEVLAAAHRGQT